ncbi:hypothetical protein WR25_22461 [Diploscapter pachys]|uniref:Protein kinase domain-containing protein n=1 Tax=Diploscapter pachys TaxID=2018661 RepID=A0A2A2KDY6_9BILA|nr:hypothetical protein WR25_22461 [Diploscapter pachys]
MFLQEFGKHPNVIKLFNIHKADNDRDIYLIFEYMEADLHNVIKKGTILKDVHKQYIMCQLFRAIRFLHSGNVLHRDLKPSNVLLDADCRAKLADFGLARSLTSLEDYPEGQKMPELTEYVATRWYRSPEILLAAKRYTKGVDMWSLGCILAEMLIGRALFPGASTINQIERIMNTIVKPSKQDIQSIGSYYAASVLEKMPQRPRKPLEVVIPPGNPHALDMINRLLIFAPHKRMTVEQCLVHPYVVQFHSPQDEPSLPYDVTLPLPDHIQLTIDDYRNKLYDMMQQKKTSIRRIHHEKIKIEETNGHLNRRTSPPKENLQSNGTHDSPQKGSQGGQTMWMNPAVNGNGHSKAAPIAQAECSDTDYDTARSRGISVDKAANGSLYDNSTGGTLRERAQSADSRTSKGSNSGKQSSSGQKERRRSIERPRLFSAIKSSNLMQPHKLISNY